MCDLVYIDIDIYMSYLIYSDHIDNYCYSTEKNIQIVGFCPGLNCLFVCFYSYGLVITFFLLRLKEINTSKVFLANSR